LRLYFSLISHFLLCSIPRDEVETGKTKMDPRSMSIANKNLSRHSYFTDVLIASAAVVAIYQNALSLSCSTCSNFLRSLVLVLDQRFIPFRSSFTKDCSCATDAWRLPYLYQSLLKFSLNVGIIPFWSSMALLGRYLGCPSPFPRYSFQTPFPRGAL